MALIWDGKFRGLADSKFSGVAGSFAECVGIDGHSVPGLLQVHQKLTKDSGTTVTDLCQVATAVSTGETFWFSNTSGKIWRRSSTGTWLLVYTTAPAAGGTGCLGAKEYNGFLYWATQSRLHRISMATAHATAADWTANVALNWQIFAVTDNSWHPMAIQDLTLFIGDGNQIASVNSAGTFDNNALDIKTPFRVKTMIPYGIDLLIGTFVANTINKTAIIRWDCVSASWNTSDTIEEVGINAFIQDDNYVYVNAGRAGNLYFYNGEQLVPFKKIPGTYTNLINGYVFPNAAGNYKGIPIFGFSYYSGDPAKQGIYSLGSYSRDYPKVLDLSWVISQNSTSQIEIGAILVVDFDILVSWNDGAGVRGVDKIDYTAKYASAYFETMVITKENRAELKTLAGLKALYNSLPSGTSFKIYYSKNNAAYVEITEDFDNSILNAWEAQLSVDGIGSLQIKVEFIVSGNTAPNLEALDIDFE